MNNRIYSSSKYPKTKKGSQVPSAPSPFARHPHPLLAEVASLQGSIGNQVVQKWLKPDKPRRGLARVARRAQGRESMKNRHRIQRTPPAGTPPLGTLQPDVTLLPVSSPKKHTLLIEGIPILDAPVQSLTANWQSRTRRLEIGVDLEYPLFLKTHYTYHQSNAPRLLFALQKTGVRRFSMVVKCGREVLWTISSPIRIPDALKALLNAYARYENQKQKLERELSQIRLLKNPALKKQKQIAFLEKIQTRILGRNDIDKLELAPQLSETKFVRRGNQWVRQTTVANAVTGWIDANDKSKGVKAAFNQVLFNDSLASIILTVLHESTHGRQLKSKIPSAAFPYGRERVYYAALNALIELDAYAVTLHSPFFRRLPVAEKGRIKKFHLAYEKDAKAALDQMKDPGFYAVYQKKLEKFLPQFKMLQQWFKENNLPPWPKTR